MVLANMKQVVRKEKYRGNKIYKKVKREVMKSW